ncbi:MAG TPA: helix-turn-helix domain-containing protein [Solirubrobacteraceae bacterium]|jgi:excisionase family DNA binding protein
MTDPYLTVDEVAELARCEHKRVRRAIAAGELEAFKPGRRLVVREQDARAWVEGFPVGRRAPRPRRLGAGQVRTASVSELREIEQRANASAAAS